MWKEAHCRLGKVSDGLFFWTWRRLHAGIFQSVTIQLTTEAFMLQSKTGNYKFVTMSGRKISLEYKDLQSWIILSIWEWLHDNCRPEWAVSRQPGAAPWVQSDGEVRPEWAKALLCVNNAFAHSGRLCVLPAYPGRCPGLTAGCPVRGVAIRCRHFAALQIIVFYQIIT